MTCSPFAAQGVYENGRLRSWGGGGMAKRKYSEVEMIGALKQMEAGRSAAEGGGEVGVGKDTVYGGEGRRGGVRGGGGERLRAMGEGGGRGREAWGVLEGGE